MRRKPIELGLDDCHYRLGSVCYTNAAVTHTSPVWLEYTCDNLVLIIAAPSLFRRHHFTDDEVEETEEEGGEDGSDSGNGSEKGDQAPPTHRAIITKAAVKLLLGTALCALFSDPMVEAVSGFSKVGGVCCDGEWFGRGVASSGILQF